MTDPGVLVSEGVESGTSLGLLDRVKAQDQAAWQRLVLLYEPLIDYWCRQNSVPEAEIPDIRQDVLLAVARNIRQFRRDAASGSFRGWLRIITRGKICDYRKRRAANPPGVGGDKASRDLDRVQDRADEAALDVEQCFLYRKAMALIALNFEEQTWRAFLAIVVEGRPPAEVAKELGVSVNTVYLAKSRVLARLREEFADLLDCGDPG